ncbi:hypothetical protein F4781DRAFT_178069 [Annulohypoxylon bovei var. microspora]|nr:hypothetical protein F4781DRAFT_178069 [Annulohypoxylon bovei var. microspora]
MGPARQRLFTLLSIQAQILLSMASELMPSPLGVSFVIVSAVVNINKYVVFPSDIGDQLVGPFEFSKVAWDDRAFIFTRRRGGDDDMAGNVLHLASKAGSYCNGSILVNDGGKLSALPAAY